MWEVGRVIMEGGLRLGHPASEFQSNVVSFQEV